jgi:cytidyltransferase-like protein
MSKRKTIMVSGGFDPVHVGHLRMFQQASQFGKLIVVLNSDDWLARKKGYSFMSFEDRKEIIEGFECVWKVVGVDDSDETVIDALHKYRPDIFANGGDRFAKNTPESTICEKLEIETLWGVGGEKIRSSSDLVKESKKYKPRL